MNIHYTAEIALHTGSAHPESAPRARKTRSVPATNEDLEPDEQQTLTSWEDRMFFDLQQMIDGVFSVPQPKIEPPTRLELLREELDRRLSDIRMKFAKSLLASSPPTPTTKMEMVEESTPEREQVRAAFARLNQSVPPQERLAAFFGFFTGGDGF